MTMPTDHKARSVQPTVANLVNFHSPAVIRFLENLKDVRCLLDVHKQLVGSSAGYKAQRRGS